MSHCAQKLQCPRVCACGDEVRAEEAEKGPRKAATGPLTALGTVLGLVDGRAATNAHTGGNEGTA